MRSTQVGEGQHDCRGVLRGSMRRNRDGALRIDERGAATQRHETEVENREIAVS